MFEVCNKSLKKCNNVRSSCNNP